MNKFLDRFVMISLFLIFPIISESQEIDNYLLKVKSLLDRGMYGSVIEVAESGDRDDYRAILMCGEAALRGEDYSLALGYFVKADRLMDGSGQLGLARVYAAKGDPETAVYHLEQHLSSSCRRPERELMMDQFFLRIDESRPWVRLWHKEWYNSLEKGVEEVEYLVSRGRLTEAADVALSFKGLYSDDPAVDYINGVLAFSAGNYDEASSFLRESLNSDKGKFRVWSLYIKSLGMKGDYPGVIRASGEAASLFPDNLEFRISLAGGLKMTGDSDRAYKISTDLLQYYPENKDLLSMAASLAGSSGNYPDALRYLSRNIDNNRGDAAAFAERGDLYLKSGSYEFAGSDYSMSLDLDPLNGDVWYNKALVLIYEKRIDEACHDLKMALRYGNRKASALINRHCMGK
ncbi:MAG: tetratricopeptide repeat protein [Bacteroidales bacterium]|nr:tetratricopeptide repeat protein [Bacteroidales bacterium]